MGRILDSIARLTRPYQEENEEHEMMIGQPPPPGGRRASAPEFINSPRKSGGDENVINIHTTTKMQVVMVKPDRFECAVEVAAHLREKRTVMLNLEAANKEISRRLIDFLSGVAYALDGQVKKVANSTYVITPYNVEIIGDLLDELENNGMYF